MSSEFFAVLGGADARGRARLQATRDRFLRERERCGDEECVANVYADRVEEIREIEADSQ